MDDRELKHRLRQILQEEERGDRIDWAQVERLCQSLEDDLKAQAPAIVLTYVASFHFRRVDSAFAKVQRAQLVQFLRGIEGAATS